MLKGMIYDPSDAELEAKRIKAHKLSKDFNDTYEDETEKRALILKQLIPNIGEGTAITSPVYFMIMESLQQLVQIALLILFNCS